MPSSGPGTAMAAFELRMPPVPLAFIFGILMWLVAWFTPQGRIVLPWATGLAVVLGVAGAVLAGGGVAAFRSARTTTNPLRPDAVRTIVTSGVYRLSRNPMYAGLLLCLAGWAMQLSHPLPLVFLPLFVAYLNRFQIIPEERVLEARFDGAYRDYRKAVRRWL